jgi:hypothetical protein
MACGSSYTLESHGSEEAQSTAKALENGIDPSTLPPVISRCPGCMNAKLMSEQEAVAAAMLIGAEADKEGAESVREYLKLTGVLFGVLSICGMFITIAFEKLKKEGDFHPAGFLTLCLVGALAGAGLIAYAKLSGKKKQPF